MRAGQRCLHRCRVGYLSSPWSRKQCFWLLAIAYGVAPVVSWTLHHGAGNHSLHMTRPSLPYIFGRDGAAVSAPRPAGYRRGYVQDILPSRGASVAPSTSASQGKLRSQPRHQEEVSHRNASALSASARDRKHDKLEVFIRVPLNNFKGMQYWGEFTIGNQILPAIYDTGSFEVVVMSSLCTTCHIHDRPVYSSAKSTTYTAGDGSEVVHTYASGPVTTQMDFETLRIGNPSSPIVAEHMEFWQVLDHGVDVWEDGSSSFTAIIGMPQTGNVPTGAKGPTMLTRSGVQRFGICIDSTLDSDGILDVNPVVPLPQGFQVMNVVGTMHWALQLSVARYSDIINTCESGCAALLDSGTSVIAAPYGALVEMLPILDQVERDCSNIDMLPDLDLEIGGVQLTLPPLAWVVQVQRAGPAHEHSTADDFFDESDDEVVCVPAFIEINKRTQYGPLWIFGLPFFRAYYTLFDRAGKQVHVRQSDPSCDAVAPAVPAAGQFLTPKLQNRSLAGATGRKKLAQVDPHAFRLPAWALEPGDLKA